jgi:hypothetical protein
MNIMDLINNIAPDTQKRVEKAKNSYNRLIRDAIRFESRLSLNSGQSDNFSEDTSIKIPVKLEAGYPDWLEGFVVPPEFRIAALLSEIRPALVQLEHSADVVGEFIADYQHEPEIDPFVGDSICHASTEARQLLALLEGYDLVRELLNINRDILGLYHSTTPWMYRHRIDIYDPHLNSEGGEVLIYWAVIGIIAPRLGVSVEALTAVVLAHELSHAYTHAGFDIDGNNWPADSFFGSDSELTEGLAQYYTERVLQKLDHRIPGAYQAYELLLEKQSGPYRRHLHWTQELQASPEQIRQALLKVRRYDSIPVQEFEHHLKHR